MYIDDTMHVEMNLDADIEIEGVHVSGHIQSNKKLSCFSEQIIDFLQVDSTTIMGIF